MSRFQWHRAKSPILTAQNRENIASVKYARIRIIRVLKGLGDRYSTDVKFAGFWQVAGKYIGQTRNIFFPPIRQVPCAENGNLRVELPH